MICGLALLAPMGCTTASNAYYSAWSKLGYEKRDILVSRVETARDDQTEAKTQFKTTLDQFKALTNFNGGDLEAEYKKLKSSYEACQDDADKVSKKITSVDNVANAMFDEWTKELDDYHDAGLRAASAQKLNDSKAKYAQLLAAMRNSESKMKPVLDAFQDRVHFLRDNLNAAAISSLGQTSAEINTNVQDLIAQMDASINEANSFIDNMKKT
jgi:septation ring formation regulator EzrA